MKTEEQIKNAIAWIEALLSGKYPQGYCKLGNDETGYCCWGLGCMIVGMDYDPEDRWNDSFADRVGFIESDGVITPAYSFLSDEEIDEQHMANLAGLNDVIKLPFPEIGQYLIDHAETNFHFEVAKGIKEHFAGK